jgi:putative oxidoreductase
MSIPKIATVISPFIRVFNWLSPFGDFAARLWVAQIFFMSGLVKLQAWQSTKMLFAHVYDVPLLPPNFAAILGTTLELLLPILLVLGLGGRFVILIFFLYNAVCAISYPFLWTAAGAAGLSQHINWGLLLMMLMFHGSGKISLDYWIRERHGHHLDLLQ